MFHEKLSKNPAKKVFIQNPKLASFNLISLFFTTLLKQTSICSICTALGIKFDSDPQFLYHF